MRFRRLETRQLVTKYGTNYLVAGHVRKSKEIEEQAFDMFLGGKNLGEIATFMGFGSIQSLQRYTIAHPEFAEQIERARLMECVRLEEEFRNVTKEFDDAGMARVQVEVISKLLKWRDQKKYGDKTQIDMNINIDISGSLEKAEKRVIDVTYSNVLALKPKNE